MTSPVIALSGISGIGKTTALQRLQSAIPKMQILRASALIKDGRDRVGHSIDHDALRLHNIDDNQRFLTDGFATNVDPDAALVIIDCHTVIETEAGLIKIEPTVFASLRLCAMIILVDDPARIGERRAADRTRQRSIVNADRLAEIQAEAIAQGQYICNSLGLPLKTYSPNDDAGILAYLSAFLAA